MPPKKPKAPKPEGAAQNGATSKDAPLSDQELKELKSNGKGKAAAKVQKPPRRGGKKGSPSWMQHALSLLAVIAGQFSQLPAWLKLFVTSREEPQIKQALDRFSPTELRADEAKNKADVEIFLRTIARKHVKGQLSMADIEADVQRKFGIDMDGKMARALPFDKDLKGENKLKVLSQNIFFKLPKGADRSQLTYKFLHEKFEKYGKIKSTKISLNADFTNRGYAFVCFQDPESTKKCVDDLAASGEVFQFAPRETKEIGKNLSN